MTEKNSLYKFFAIISLLRNFLKKNYYIRKYFLLSIKLVNITFYKSLELRHHTTYIYIYNGKDINIFFNGKFN